MHWDPWVGLVVAAGVAWRLLRRPGVRPRRRVEKRLQRLEPPEPRPPGTGDRTTFGEDEWGISTRHRQATLREDRLARFGLPVLRTEAELAAWLGLPLSKLRWFTWDRAAERVYHYVRYVVPKARGGERVLLAPHRELKALQRKVLRDMVERVPVSEQAHGFVRGRSIRTNAAPHVGQPVLLKMDLLDFFPSVTFARVRGLFIWMGYPFSVAAALALLTTEHDRVPFERDGVRYFISLGARYLVQGAPTSPALANLVAWRLDRRLDGLARKHGFAYTRYADDLTFSGPFVEGALTVLKVAQRIVFAEQFQVRSDKTRLIRKGGRHMVTGVVVNDVIGTPRALRRRLRAAVHRKTTDRSWLAGMVGYVNAVNPEQAKKLKSS
ncbi:MAG TPA: reverse transcriptase family protein [Candidatus Xenobia bacterium]|jgi:retron-type reverse transcriptase